MDVRLATVINDATIGGAQTFSIALAEALGYARHDLVVLLGRGALSDRYEDTFNSVTYLDSGRGIRDGLVLRRNVARALQALHPNIVHTHLLQADAAVLSRSGRRRYRHVSTVHSTGYGTSDPLLTRALSRSIPVLSRSIDAVVACGSGAETFMHVSGYRAPIMARIDNGVWLAASAESSPVESPPVILSLSRWHPMKDHGNLFRAVRHVLEAGVDVQLACAGMGMNDENSELGAALAAAGIPRNVVTLHGEIDDPRQLIRSASTVVISSAYGEALPMAGIEAIAEGVPVVTTDIGSCRELAVDRRFVVPPRNSKALADALTVAVTPTSFDRRRMADQLRLLAQQRFSVASSAAAYDDLYRSLL